MDKKQATEIIDLVVNCYPSFLKKKTEFDKPEVRLNVLMRKMLESDYHRTLEKVDNYIETNRFEPTISDLIPVKSHSDIPYLDEKGVYDE